ncbi:MAG: hypothetical protein Q8L88_04525, partial [Bacteroidota bacterium]|nr:hypothetical protein [Bacteroidota bacterium]
MKNFIIKNFLVFAILCIPFDVLYMQEEYKNDSYVAKSGNIFISEREFVQRFELLPGLSRQRRSQIETAKSEFLYTLIAEKLLAQEAIERRFDQDTTVQRVLLAIRKKLSRDELYRFEISQKIKITNTEIARGISLAQILPLTSYLFLKKKDDAVFVRRQLKKSADFETLTIDSTFH